MVEFIIFYPNIVQSVIRKLIFIEKFLFFSLIYLMKRSQTNQENEFSPNCLKLLFYFIYFSIAACHYGTQGQDPILNIVRHLFYKLFFRNYYFHRDAYSLAKKVKIICLKFSLTPLQICSPEYLPTCLHSRQIFFFCLLSIIF